MSRTLNSAKNLIAGISISVVMTLLGFITRKIFVDTIGVEYLGLNGLLQNILGIMTLLEGGFATSVIYNMYKPLAEDNKVEILGLLQLYKKVYRYIALGISIFGLCLYPFLEFFIEDSSDLDYLGTVYFIFLFNSIIQYFTAYKWSLINASQQNYKLATINLSYQIILSISKIAILYITKNYILFLIVESICNIGLNIAVVRKANKLFPYIVNAPKYKVSPSVKKNIITNMKALFLHSLGGYFMHSTDNIVMSAYLGVGIVGLYSNYTLLTSTIKSFTNQILNSFSESVGNLIASESRDHSYKVFKTIYFVNFLTVSVPVIVLAVTAQPFLNWWLGEQYVLSNMVLALILLNFYIDGMRTTLLTFKSKAGIFTKDKFTPLLQGLINLILSLLFVRYWGLNGVLIATSISIIAISFWQWPRLIYRYVFHVKLKEFFYHYFFYFAAFIISLITSLVLASLFNSFDMLLQVIINCLISLVVTIGIYIILFRKTSEYSQLKHYCLSVFNSKSK